MSPIGSFGTGAVMLLAVVSVGGATSLATTERPLLEQAGEPVAAAATRQDPTPAMAPIVPGGSASGGPRVVDPAWVERTAAAAGLPVPAMRAYATAQLDAGQGCGIGWTTLAGVGWIESQHGTIAGRELQQDGRSSSGVIGPRLDGSGAVAAIRASTAGTALHGDPIWEHAVGPMQFLPSTWGRWGTDGDGDGVEDPFDLDDAAAAAAAYLCADGHDLTTPAGWQDAVFSYNHSRDYVLAVHAAATAYADRAASASALEGCC